MRTSMLEDRVNAILDRDSGTSYPDVLDIYGLTPFQFLRAVNRLQDFTEITKNGKLNEISSDPVRKRELFNMGEEFIKEQYDRISAGIQAHLYRGTLMHPENVNILVYYALISNNPRLASPERKEIIDGIKNLPKDLHDYFHRIWLGGSMHNASEKEKQGSPFAVLEIFDKVYQRNTGDSSLFDLTQKEHLHRWGNNFQVPRSYWQNQANVEEAVYHTLTEDRPELVSKDRNIVIQEIKSLPINLEKYILSIGLGGLMNHAFKKGSYPVVVLKVFDRVYQREIGNPSLFDKTQDVYLEFDNQNRLIR